MYISLLVVVIGILLAPILTAKSVFKDKLVFLDTIGDQCADEIERVLEQRAISVNLHPEIEDQVQFNFTEFSEICQF